MTPGEKLYREHCRLMYLYTRKKLPAWGLLLNDERRAWDDLAKKQKR